MIPLHTQSPVRLCRLSACIALAIAAGFAGCRGDTSDSPPRQFFPDMDDQPKLKPQSRSDFFKEYDEPGSHGGGAGGHGDGHEGEHAKDTSKMFGRGMRDPVANTIAFARTSEVETDGTANFMGKDFGGRADLLREDDAVYVGYIPVLDEGGKQAMNPDGTKKRTYLDSIPIPVTKELIAEGRAQYNILCITCHGGTGVGDGLVGQKWAYALPNYHDPKYFPGGEKGQDGYLFSVIREGVPNVGGPATMPYKMRPYKSKLTEHESWAVIAYIRTLQQHRKGTMNDVPADQREKLMQINTNPMPTPPAGAVPAAGAMNSGGSR